MTAPILNAKPRTLVGKKTYHLRNEGLIPAVVYGADLKEPLSIQLSRNEFARLYRDAGESSIVDLQIEGGKTLPVLIQDFQIDPLRDEVTHADFRAVDMNKPIEAVVKLKFVGEAPAVKTLGGTLVTPINTVSIKALPKNLVAAIEVDLSALSTFEDAIHIKDLKVPEGIEVLGYAQSTIAVVSAPRSDEEMAKLDQAEVGDVSKVEVLGAKKEDEAAAEEGKVEEKKNEKA